DVMRCCAAEMAPHRNPPLPNQQQQPKTAGANSKLDKTWGQGQTSRLALPQIDRKSAGKAAAENILLCEHLMDMNEPPIPAMPRKAGNRGRSALTKSVI
ncbi:hypothetical protein, partial [Rhizobium leguminosarum]|uniref:hypothetical protein n=1 Tax=Rhizobium leguminosarum TaxID=384 RepID=UPI0019542A2E